MTPRMWPANRGAGGEAGRGSARLRPALGRAAAGFVRHTTTTALIWTGSLTLGAADVLYAGLVPGSRSTLARTATYLAVAAGVVFVYAAVRACALSRGASAPRWSDRAGTAAVMVAGRGDGNARARLPFRGTRPDAVQREAELGLIQIEAWLARQDHSRDG